MEKRTNIYRERFFLMIDSCLQHSTQQQKGTVLLERKTSKKYSQAFYAFSGHLCGSGAL
jgi:hypothetical protein